MYFLLSGEGPTDMGLCTNNIPMCEGSFHEPGPMALIVSRLVEQHAHFSLMDTRHYGYVSKSELVRKASTLKSRKKTRLPGKRRPKETTYFFYNARALALCAMETEARIDDEVVAVLFRDSDGTASAGRGLWKDKWDSVVRGFKEEGFEKGVPMIPKPKSEAWIICAVKMDPYQNCRALENRSGNDKSPNALKVELAGICGGLPTRRQLCEMVEDGTIDAIRIEMPSFIAFKTVLLSQL